MEPKSPYQQHPQQGYNPNTYQGYQAGAGQPQGQPYGAPQVGQPQYGQPQFGQPQYGQPQYGQPQYGQPQVGPPPFVNEQQMPYGDLEGQKGPLLANLSDTSLRLGFVRKVYSILTIQLTITALVCIVPFFSDAVAKFQRNNLGLLLVAIVLILVTEYAIICYKSLARSYPTNYILLLIFTLAEAYLVSFVCAQYDREVVLLAAALTAAVTCSLTLYACTTKTDFTICGGLLFVCSLCLIALGIVGIFFNTLIFQLLYSIAGVILYSIYLIYDTQLIMGGEHTYQLSLDDYVIGALVIYIDIIILFLRILRILSIVMKK